MKVIAAVTEPLSIKRYLEGTGQSPEIPALLPPRAPPQLEMEAMTIVSAIQFELDMTFPVQKCVCGVYPHKR